MKANMDYKIDQKAEDLYLITLLPPIKGFGDFIGVWLYRNETTFLVDVGPSVCVGDLKKALKRVGFLLHKYCLSPSKL